MNDNTANNTIQQSMSAGNETDPICLTMPTSYMAANPLARGGKGFPTFNANNESGTEAATATTITDDGAQTDTLPLDEQETVDLTIFDENSCTSSVADVIADEVDNKNRKPIKQRATIGRKGPAEDKKRSNPTKKKFIPPVSTLVKASTGVPAAARKKEVIKRQITWLPNWRDIATRKLSTLEEGSMITVTNWCEMNTDFGKLYVLFANNNTKWWSTSDVVHYIDAGQVELKKHNLIIKMEGGKLKYGIVSAYNH